MSFFSGFGRTKTKPIPHYGKMIICPSSYSLYLDVEHKPSEAPGDTISHRNFRWARDNYSIVIPGLMEWCERYRQAIDKTTNMVSKDFDWRTWHRDGLLFTKEIYRRLPRHIPLRYARPVGDCSGLVEDFDVTEEQIDSLLAQLGDPHQERCPVIMDNVVVGVKIEDGELCIRLKTKGKFDSFTFYLDYEALEQLKDFLERIVQSEGQPTAWETDSQNGIYFYPQSIGDCPHMGQLHIYTQGQSLPDFTAYVNIRHFVRSIYRSLMAHDSGDSQKTAYKYLQSNMLEWYIDDESYEKFQMFRKKPQMAKWLSPAIVKFKDYLSEIYEGILNEDERV
jgi:hypothetical protein